MNANEPSRIEFHTPTANPARSRRRWWWALGGLAVVAAIGAVWWTHRTPPGPAGGATQGPGGAPGRFDAAGRPQPVGVATVTQGAIDVRLTALGTVVPRNVVTVHPRVDGQLVRVLFQEGQLVNAGDVLALIDPRPFEVQLGSANGQLERDTAQLKNAQADLERYRTLLAQDSIARQQVDTQEALVRQYAGAVAADRASVDSAQLQLSFTRVTAPLSGRVGLRQIDPGNMVHATDANGLVVITEVQPISVVFTLPQDRIPGVLKRVRGGATLAVEAWDREGRTKLADGKLLTLDNQIDTATGTVKLKAEFANADNALFPNQFVNVTLLVETLDHATIAPTAAIQRGAPGLFVYAVKNDATVTIRPVTLGATDGDRVAIVDGLAPADRVVIDGTDKLREGAKVEIIDRSAPAATAPGDRTRRGNGQAGRATGQRPAASASTPATAQPAQ